MKFWGKLKFLPSPRYDFNGTGVKNVEANPLRALRYKDAVFAAANAHPNLIKHVSLLDAPHIVEHLWRMGRPMCPQKFADAVEFVYTKDEYGVSENRHWFRHMCAASQLPRYLGGTVAPVGVEYHEWLLKRVAGDSLMY